MFVYLCVFCCLLKCKFENIFFAFTFASISSTYVLSQHEMKIKKNFFIILLLLFLLVLLCIFMNFHLHILLLRIFGSFVLHHVKTFHSILIHSFVVCFLFHFLSFYCVYVWVASRQRKDTFLPAATFCLPNFHPSNEETF